MAGQWVAVANTTDGDAAKVIDAEQIRADSKLARDDSELLVKIAGAIGTTVDECVRIRTEYPDKWQSILADLGLAGDKPTLKVEG
jgi:hypothetical protein